MRGWRWAAGVYAHLEQAHHAHARFIPWREMARVHQLYHRLLGCDHVHQRGVRLGVR